MSAKQSRGWEKKPAAASAPAPAVVSKEITVDQILEGMSPDDRAAHRSAFLHLVQSLPGVEVDLDVIDNRTVRGVFYTATPFKGEEFKVVVKGAREFRPSDVPESIEPASVVISNFSDIAVIRSGKIDLNSKSFSTEFQTDSSIKKHGDMSFLEGRELQALNSAWLDPTTSTSLSAGAGGNITWDQFKTNETKFGVKSSFNEELYTKKVDYSTLTREQIQFAERMAREIEGTASSNIHIQEERGHVLERDIDEEDRFSGVLTSTPNSAAATPPPQKENAWARGSKIITQGVASTNTSLPGSAKSSKAPTPKGGSTPTKAGADRGTPGASPVPTAKQPLLSAPPNLTKVADGSEKSTKAPAVVTSTVTTSTTVTAVSTTAVSTSPITATAETAPTTVTTAEVAATPAKAPEVAEAPAAATPAAEEKKSETKLSADAKPFVMKATAKAFVPGGAPATPMAAPAPLQQQVPPPLMPPQGMPMMVPPYAPYPGGPGVPPTPPNYKSPSQPAMVISPGQPPMVPFMLPPEQQYQQPLPMMEAQGYYYPPPPPYPIMQPMFDQNGMPIYPADPYMFDPNYAMMQGMPPQYPGQYLPPQQFSPGQFPQQQQHHNQNYSQGYNGYNKNHDNNRNNNMGGRGGGGYQRNNYNNNNRDNRNPNRGGTNSQPGTPTRAGQSGPRDGSSANSTSTPPATPDVAGIAATPEAAAHDPTPAPLPAAVEPTEAN